MESLKRNNGIFFYLFLFLFSVYFLSSAGNNINSAEHQLARFEQTRSIIEGGCLSIPDGMGIKGNYYKNYSLYGLGQPILAIPFYVVGKSLGGYQGAQVMISLLNQFAVAASGVVLFFFIINLGYTKRTAFIVTVFYALGTLAWPQAKQPFDHPVEMLFVLLAVFYVHRYAEDGRTGSLLLSSASLGYAFLTRASAVLALPPIFVFLYCSRSGEVIPKKRIVAVLKDCAVYSLVFLLFVIIQLWYNFARFGSIFETGMTLMAQKAGIDFFTGTRLFTGLSGFLISPGKGFFFYSPIAVLIFFSLKGFYKRQRGLTFCIMGITVSYLIFLSKNLYWHGDWAWGPRYLLVITPLLMLPIADLVQNKFHREHKFIRYAIIGLFFVSIVVQVIGVSVDYQRYFMTLQAEKGVKFTLVGGNDVPVIFEPPPATQFEWDKFPIAYQVAYDWKILKNVKGPLSLDEEKKAPDAQEKHARPLIFDFWWYAGAYSGFSLSAILSMLGLLGFIITLSAFRVFKMVKT